MNFNLHLHPGPRDDSLLYLGAEHRARNLFLDPQEWDRCTIDFKRGDATLWEQVVNENIIFPRKVLKYIDLLDRALIEALIERWRPETNTFHMPFGEFTVTLEDVNVLLGLPTEGMALSWHEESYIGDQRIHTCQTYLGLDAIATNFKSHMLRLSTLIGFMFDYPVTDDSTDEQCIQRARCGCLILSTKIVLADSNNAQVSLHLLSHLTGFNISGQMSYGAASLACLYRELYKGTMPKTLAIGGPMALLQIWAWTRIGTIAPKIVDPNIDWNRPYGARWADHDLNKTETPSHVLKANRQTLQNLREADFDWMLYRHVMRRLPPMCRTRINSWRSLSFLIYWNVVEYHLAERVMRQFRFLQEIPPPFPLSRRMLLKLREKLRKGSLDNNWSIENAVYIENWNNKHTNVVEGVPINTPTTHHTYNDWFHRHTVLYIKDPRHIPGHVHTGIHDHSGHARYLVDGLSIIGEEAIRMRNMGPSHYYENFGGVQDMASQLIGSISHTGQPLYIQELIRADKE